MVPPEDPADMDAFIDDWPDFPGKLLHKLIHTSTSTESRPRCWHHRNVDAFKLGVDELENGEKITVQL